MKYKGPFSYTILLAGTKTKRVIAKKTKEGKITNFKHPTTAKGVPKIYILKQKQEIVYVGYASQSISKRLGQGLRANGRRGDHGYKWKEASELELLVFVFDQKLTTEKGHNKPYVQLAEAVEAELVFLIREKTGKWPRFQNEIHFNNENSEKAKEIATKFYLTVFEENKSDVESTLFGKSKSKLSP